MSAVDPSPATTTLRPTGAEDLASLAVLFEDRFGHGLEPEDWEWKYRRSPGEARSLVAVRGGRVVAHGGALALPARLADGRTAPIWTLTDWVGDPAGGGLRPPLVALGRRLMADLPRPGDAPWIFGFPSERHFRLGRRVFGYRPLPALVPREGSLAEAGARAEGETDGGTDRGADPGELVAVADHPGGWEDEALAAWRACAVASVRRDAAFLAWRYHARPGRYYRFHRLAAGRGEGRRQGFAVFAFVGSEARATELWLPPGPDWTAALAASAADLAAAGLERWTTWPPPRPDLDGVLGRLGLTPRPDAAVTMGWRGAADGAAGPDPDFHYAMGDYDLA